MSACSVLAWVISLEQSNAGCVNIVFSGSKYSQLLFLVLHLGRGLKVNDILKDDEVLTAFLLRDADLSDSIVYQLVNAEIRLEQVKGCV